MDQQYVILTLSGEYDIASRSALKAELEAVRDSKCLVVDLSGVTFLDSSCIGELIGLHGARVSAGYPRLTVVQNELIVRRLFELLGLDQVFHTVDSVDDIVPADHGPIIRQYATGGDSRTSLTAR